MRPTTQSGMLTEFYNHYSMWIRAGAPLADDIPFVRNDGLCYNLICWLRHNSERRSRSSRMKIHPSDEMEMQFEAAGYRKEFPFNRHWYSYKEESAYSQCHLNRDRVEWALRHSDLVE
ncbi:hypothetical protein EVB62_002 [Rhizobium phage RHph_TM33]|uniref:Uncharacterized protein n=1 Tax=Rhizobium phage RHph_TM33 TaxID=2509765 RepID=A0A7S5R9W1_9CAUD|nr:hypothetical protein EVB62_002 [Rhizobium phage RHph_TM33]QIG68461.1 hypothetical protein EVB63_002 [Rhizobium phage RHph_TM38]